MDTQMETKMESFSVDIQKDPRKRTDRPLTPLSATFNFVVLMVGTSMAATPSSFSLTTPIGGVIVEIILGLLSWWAAVCIFNAASITDATSFTDVGKRVFGHDTKGLIYSHLLISLPLIIVMVGALGGYIIIASTTFELYIDVNPSLMRFLLTLVVSVLGSIKSFEFSKYVSYPAFFAFLLIVVFTLVVTFEFYGDMNEPEAPLQFSNFIRGLPILALGLNGHMGLPGMAAEMKKSRHASVAKYLFVGQFIVVIYNSAVGYFPADMYGAGVGGHILTELNITYESIHGKISPLILAANIMLSAVVIIQAPLVLIPLKEIVLDNGTYTVRERSMLTNIIASFIISFIAGAIAIFIPDLNDALNTVATVGSLVITGPAAAVLSLATENTTYSKTRSYIIFIVGIILLICNFYTIWYSFTQS